MATILNIRVDDISGNVRIIDEGGEFHDFNIKKELQINKADIGTEFLNQPNKYVFWGTILEKLNMYLDSTKWQMEVLEANLRDEARIFYAKKGVKTNAQMIDDYAKKQDAWQKKRKYQSQIEYMVKQVKLIVKSFEQRKDMLQSYGAQLRNEVNYGNNAGNVPKY